MRLCAKTRRASLSSFVFVAEHIVSRDIWEGWSLGSLPSIEYIVIPGWSGVHWSRLSSVHRLLVPVHFSVRDWW